MVTTLLRIEARRPRVWITTATAAVVGRELSLGGPVGGLAALAIGCGGVLAVAAMGRLPTGVPVGRAVGSRLAWLRVAWVLLGLAGGVGMAACSSRGVPAPLFPILAAAAAVGTASVYAGGVRAGWTQPVAAGHALTLAGAAGVAAVVAATAGGGGPVPALAALTAWLLLAAGTWVDQAAAGRDWISVSSSARHRSAEPAQGIAMATSLAAMATCFFLAPQLSWAYAAIAVAWFVCLTVPPATEFTAAAAGRRLVAAATGRPALPGAPARALRLAVVVVGILGWPAVVAAVVPTLEAGGASGPLAALGWLATVAGVMLVAVASASSCGAGETARAAVLALVALAAVEATRVAESPSLPALWRPGGRALATSGVEPWSASCKTPRSTPKALPSQATPGWVEKEAAGAR